MTKLNAEERSYVNSVRRSDTSEKPVQSILLYACLLVGALFFVASALITLQNLNDRVVYFVFLPGTLGSLFLVLVYIVGEKWCRNRRLVASILRKTTGPASNSV